VSKFTRVSAPLVFPTLPWFSAFNVSLRYRGGRCGYTIRAAPVGERTPAPASLHGSAAARELELFLHRPWLFPKRLAILSRQYALVLLGAVLVPGAFGQSGFLAYSTYIGGNGADKVNSIATDAEGNVYLTGETFSADLPVTPAALQSQHAGRPGTLTSVFAPSALADAFVMKLGPSGELLYATYLGGSGHDLGRSIAVDADGNAYLLGSTESSDFPTTPGAFQPSLASRGRHLFLAKLNPQGTALVYSTLLGGGGDENAGALAVDQVGNAYVTGATSSPNFRVTPAAFNGTYAPGALRMPFAAKLDAAGASLMYSTFLGGSTNGIGNGIAVDAGGNAYVSGQTSSADFPVTPGAVNTKGSEAFAVKLNAAGTTLLYAALFGGDNEIVSGVAVDAEGNAWIAGSTDSAAFPVTAEALEQVGGGYDSWVVKLNAAASEFIYAARFGGEKSELTTGIALDAQGNAYVVGSTSSEDFPASQNGLPFPASQCFNRVQSPFPPPRSSGSCGEGFLAKLGPAGSTLLYSTVLGGADMDGVESVAVDSRGNAYLAGSTRSNNFPTTQTALSNRRSPAACNFSGSPTFNVTFFCEDAFVSRVSFGEPPELPAVEVLNLGTLAFAPIAAESVVKLAGPGIGPAVPAGLLVGADGRVTAELSGTRVLFDGLPAPLLFVSADEINLIAPASVAARAKTRIDIEIGGEVITTLTVGVAGAAPALLTLDGTGTGQVAAINQDGSLNGSSNGLSSDLSAPASAGSVVALYLIGLGASGEPDGAVAVGAKDLPARFAPEVRIGGEPADVLYAGLAPGLVTAAIQINVRVPAIGGDDVDVLVSTNGYSTQPGTTMAVR